MRPLRLEFEAFGSYPGRHVVDFEALGRRGLFVVAGPTGTGKTTIFDAMVYALYGALPGARAGEGEPRSHHAEATVETFVQLDFEVEGERYRVHRTPQQERPKKRGQGTTNQAAQAVVSKLVGASTEALATQATRVTDECTRLVGLEAKHFQRVVLLPQGKFTEFLVANDESREQLLRQLFGGELYERATKLLKQRADEFDQQVAVVDEAVRHHRNNSLDAFAQVQAQWGSEPDDDEPLTDDQLLAAIDALEPARQHHRAQLAELQQQSTAATEARTQAEAAAARFADAQHHRGVLARLAETADDIAAAELAVAASRRGRPVVAAAGKVAEAGSAAGRAAEALDALRLVINDGFTALRRPIPGFDAASVAAAVQQVSQQLSEQRTLLAASRKARYEADEARALAESSTAEHLTAVARSQELAEQVDAARAQVTELEPAAGAAVACQTRLQAASAKVATRRQLDDYEHKARLADEAAAAKHGAYVTLMEQFIAATAPRLAADLHDGDPCPVCGALEHPRPAVAERGAVVEITQVDAARGEATAAAGLAQSHHAVAGSLAESLGDDASSTLEQLLAVELEAADALRSAQTADLALTAARTALSDADDGLQQAIDQRNSAELQLTAHRTAAELAEAEAVRRAGLVESLDAEQLQLDLDTSDTLAAATAGAATTFDNVTISATALQSAEATLDEALAQSQFPSVGQARAAVLPSDDEAASEQRAADWRRQHAESTTILTQLERDGIPDTPPDLDQFRAAAAQAEQIANDAAAQFTTASNALDRARNDLQQSIDVAADSAPLRQQRDTARKVFRTCNGEAGMRVKLERWVLAIELERVTLSANQHLARMTNHRYRLSRSVGQKGGLGLEVFDAHTGRSRATASLSGGEQFQASLALALGLADVVSHGGVGSGKQFEALFVDEGFGSLDPAALDDAIAALQQLQAAGRMVGAITHVEAMKQQLHVGIEVAALPDGRGSTLLVHP